MQNQGSLVGKKITLYGDGHGYLEVTKVPDRDPILEISEAARVSYNKASLAGDRAKDVKLVKFMWQHGHGSPFRHSMYGFNLCLPLFVFRQIVKYQVGSLWRSFDVCGEEVSQDQFIAAYDHLTSTDNGCTWNELSGRYAEFAPAFYVPDRMRSNAGHANKQASSTPQEWDQKFHSDCGAEMYEVYNFAFQKYKSLLEKGVAKEIARMVLPQAIYTKVSWTVSLQALLHFLKQRLAPDAQHEIRVVAQAIKSVLNEDLNRNNPETTVSLDDLLNTYG